MSGLLGARVALETHKAIRELMNLRKYHADWSVHHVSPDMIDREAWRSAPGEYVEWRATANHFALRRLDGQWRITARTSRLLDGNPEAHALLTEGVAARRAPKVKSR